MTKQEDITKVTIITVLSLSILIFGLFWLKGYKLSNEEKIKVYFQDISGLEEGAIVRWSGLRVGVVESVKPVLKNNLQKSENSFKKNKDEVIKLATKEIKESEELQAKLLTIKDSKEIIKIKNKINELNENSKIHLEQNLAYEQQILKQKQNHIEVILIITQKDLPLGPLSVVNIIPTGLIGEHYVEISPLVTKKPSPDFKSVFITEEPLRFERFLKANIESSEAFKEAIQKINSLLREEDFTLLASTIKDIREVVKNVNKLTDNASVLLSTTSEKLEQLATSSNQLSTSVIEVGENINKIIGDESVRQNLKTTTTSLNTITSQVSKLLDEQGLAKDISEIGKTAKLTSTELSTFIKELRKTHQDLEIPKTLSNLNSLSEKLDKLGSELNNIVADKEFQEDIKTTAKKTRETSENLKKISEKFSKRFLFIRLLF